MTCDAGTRQEANSLENILPRGIYEPMEQSHTHLSHPRIATRLKRANGHLSSVISMIEDRRPCADIAQQLQAVEKAITNAKRELIFDHIDHCLEDARKDAPAEGQSEMFKEIARYL